MARPFPERPWNRQLRLCSQEPRQRKSTDVIVVARNEICTALKHGETFRLVIVLVDNDTINGPHNIPQTFTQEPEVGATADTFHIDHLFAQAEPNHCI